MCSQPPKDKDDVPYIYSILEVQNVGYYLRWAQFLLNMALIKA